jgi:ABC-type lipoprotein release transport system permease subunit
MMDRLRLLLPLAWRNLWRNPRRTIITVLVVSVGLWSILTFSVLLKAWSVSSRDTTLKLMTGEGQIHATGYLDDPTVAHRMTQPDGELESILSSSAVAAYTKRLRVAAIVQSEYKTLPMTLVGTDPAQERRLSVLPDRIREGRYLDSPADTGIVLGRNLARRLRTRRVNSPNAPSRSSAFMPRPSRPKTSSPLPASKPRKPLPASARTSPRSPS